MAPKEKRATNPSVNNTLKFADPLNHQPSLDRIEDCPEPLKDIFLLINRTRLGHGDLDPQLEGQTFSASRVYEKQLVWRAQQMSDTCSVRGMNQHSEFEWQSAMSPHAFLSLNNNDEEKTHSERQYHHCLACCRVFRPGSRPLLDARLDAVAQSNAEAVLEVVDPSQICQDNIHFNLPNFVFKPQLRYYYQDEGRQKQSSEIPDATIGLCAYNLRNEPWQKQRPDLRADPRIEPFSQRSIKTIFSNYEDLKGPYPKKVLNDGVPLFAFALWEAKQSDGDSHWSAFTQLDKRVRLLLQWQDAIIKAAENNSSEFFPMVWAFTSVGSLWTVYGCYQSLFKEDEKHFGSSVELWSGNVSDKNKALQFLWIVDIIKFWAEYTYKPMIGACLARLKARVDEHGEVPLEKTLWKSHITLNKKNTPWFFHPANLPPRKRSPPHKPSSSGDSRPKLKPKSLSDQCSPWSPETAPEQILHRTLTLNEQQIDDFTWLQDIDPGSGDLLVVRIGREGKIDKPLVLLDSTMNQNTAQYSHKVLAHADVDIGLIGDGEGAIYLLQRHRGLFSSDHQFCAILPLEPKVYERRRQKSNKVSIFEPLEQLLDLEGLYRIYDLECSSHVDRKKPQMKDPSNEAGNEKHNTKSYERSCDKSTSEDKASKSKEHDDSSDDVGEEKDKEKWQKEEEDGKDDNDDDDDDNDDDSDDDDNDDDDDETTTDEDELDIQEKWNQHLEDVQKAWKRHKWPDEISQIRTFARVGLRLQLARKKAYNVKYGEIYRQVGEVPIDWMMPVKDFGESFLRVERTEKRSSFDTKSADDQSSEDSDTKQTLGDYGDKGKKGVKDLGHKLMSFGVK